MAVPHMYNNFVSTTQAKCRQNKLVEVIKKWKNYILNINQKV
jgi:hypothetical protein